MGWIMKAAGYIPFAQIGSLDNNAMKGFKSIPGFIKSGGNLFIFPEGTRSRDNRLGKFQKGAFSISARYKIPLQVLYIKNTNRLFEPGKFLLHTCVRNTISIERLAVIDPEGMSANELRDKALKLYAERMKQTD
jgi:1-acyl-sn-glycerol-3-phosphate acyltransferase